MQSLVAHPGFNLIMELAKAQAETRKQKIFLTPITKLDDTFAQEFEKGEVSGIALFMAMPQIRIADLVEEINSKLEIKENDNEEDFDA